MEFLERMDFKEIDTMDPSCKGDYTNVLTASIPCHVELDYETSMHFMQTNEQLYFRILVHGEE